MKHYLSLQDIPDFDKAILEAIALKKDPLSEKSIGRDKPWDYCFLTPV